MPGTAPRAWRHGAAGLAALLLAGLAHATDLQVLVQDAQGRPLPQAVVYLESPAAARLVKPQAGAEMVQQDKAFSPQTLVITRGSLVSFPNRDTVRHHVYSFSPAKRFELKLYAGTPANPVLFDQAGVVVLGCNIHDHMVAWVLVLETPYFTRTQGNGSAQLADVPEGNYRLRVWHHRLPAGAQAFDQALTLGAAAAQATVRLVGLGP